MSKLIILCGLIGSGKTTYARNHYKAVTDLDYMPPFSKKSDQIRLTLRLLKTHDEVCHITCFPTAEEMLAFQAINKEFVLMNTSARQCKTNILIRQRPRDMENLGKIFLANREYLTRINRARVPWRVVNVFKRRYCAKSVRRLKKDL